MFRKSSKLGEIFRFLVTGVICFGIEFIILVLLKEFLHLDTLIATPVAFLGSVTVNYFLCAIWVFQEADKKNPAIQIGFLTTSVIGLLLNEAFMLLFRLWFGEEDVLFSFGKFSLSMYMLNKVFATLLVMIWNYFTKRAMLKKSG